MRRLEAVNPGTPHPEMVREAKRLYRKNPRTGNRLSLRKIAAELAKLGYGRDGGEPFNAMTVKNMVAA